MNKIVAYIALPLVTLILAVGVMFAVSKLRPGLFQNASNEKKAETSPAAAEHSILDSVKGAPVPESNIAETAHAAAKTAAPAAGAWSDTIALLKKQIDIQQVRIKGLEHDLIGTRVMEDSAKTKERTQFVKLIDSMNPEGAAQILSSMPDADVKRVLLGVKARQAGKILSVMEPKRVARLMN